MNPSHPTQNAPDDAYKDEGHNYAPPTPSPLSPLRGEVFDAALTNDSQTGTGTPRKGAALWFVAGIALLFLTYNFGATMGARSKVPTPIGPFTEKKSAGPPLRVHIAGAVKRPGVYTLPNGARLQDAIKTAGGALPGADLTPLNLADWATDGSKIEIPTRQKPVKTAAPLPTPTPVVIIKEVFVTPPQNAPDNEIEVPKPEKIAKTAKIDDGMPRAATQSGGKSSNVSLEFLKKNPLDLNRANAAQLEVLPGVGPKMAERILTYRKENGGFKSVDDLDNVRGIGEKRMEKLRPLVRVQ
ncbi:MAG TPA: ComEA family DNA-binding protein [Abditibacterium sp.]|jgi:comEA protein